MGISLARHGSTTVLGMLTFILASSGPALAQGRSGDAIPDQYIVVLREAALPPGLSRAEAESRATAFAQGRGVGAESLERVYYRALRGFSARLSAQQRARLSSDPGVAYIEQDRLMVLGPPRPGGGSPAPTGQQVPWGITRVGGHVDGTGKTAWVIDTGVDLDHPDLKVDAARSVSFISKGRDARDADDLNGHGTHCAGTIAALDNDIGVVGVAAGATIVAVKVLDQRGSGSYSGVIAGVDYVAANAAPGDAVNMSLGGPTSQALDDAIRNAAAQGILLAIAAGNESKDANTASPARVEADNVWTVSACDSSDNFASFSNYSGPTAAPVEVCAPGVNILSTWMDGGYNDISGTSMATPHVAGLLLVTGGSLASDGKVKAGDPDGDPDPIAHRGN
ncbi:MAG: S8 family serine peptidase [Gemmatimonadota bacterium]|nr:MAG: S8 family serine peptidase [Gemmatimonadota bacterium]